MVVELILLDGRCSTRTRCIILNILEHSIKGKTKWTCSPLLAFHCQLCCYYPSLHVPVRCFFLSDKLWVLLSVMIDVELRRMIGHTKNARRNSEPEVSKILPSWSHSPRKNIISGKRIFYFWNFLKFWFFLLFHLKKIGTMLSRQEFSPLWRSGSRFRRSDFQLGTVHLNTLFVVSVALVPVVEQAPVFCHNCSGVGLKRRYCIQLHKVPSLEKEHFSINFWSFCIFYILVFLKCDLFLSLM